MTALAAESSVSLSLGDNGYVNVSTNGGLGSATATPTGEAAQSVVFGPGPYRQKLGPYTEGAVVVLSNNTCPSFDYDSFNPASGSGGDSGGGWGSDRTGGSFELDESTGEYVATIETLDGIPWTVGRDPQGREVLRQWVAGGLSRTVDYSGGGGVATGNFVVNGGEIWVAASQMPTLKTALTALGTGMLGAPRFYVQDFDGGRGLSVQWNRIDACYRPTGAKPVFMINTPVVQVNPGATESAAIMTAVFPEWLRGPRGRFSVASRVGYTNNGETKSFRLKLNGVLFCSFSPGTALGIQLVGNLECLNATDFAGPAAGQAIGAGSSGQSQTPIAQTVTAGTDLTFTVTDQLGTGTACTRTIQFLQVHYSHP